VQRNLKRRSSVFNHYWFILVPDGRFLYKNKEQSKSPGLAWADCIRTCLTMIVREGLTSIWAASLRPERCTHPNSGKEKLQQMPGCSEIKLCQLQKGWGKCMILTESIWSAGWATLTACITHWFVWLLPV
jgi:hypothetical protein